VSLINFKVVREVAEDENDYDTIYQAAPIYRNLQLVLNGYFAMLDSRQYTCGTNPPGRGPVSTRFQSRFRPPGQSSEHDESGRRRPENCAGSPNMLSFKEASHDL
jgi:hypothetical protein